MRVAVWWGYPLRLQLASKVTKLLEQQRLAVVFDLDEALILGVTQHIVNGRMNLIRQRWVQVIRTGPFLCIIIIMMS